tara:strand:+ start:2916 stop:5339 length:2424 start_codon:yes stop_codon:yes gene_type:complete
MAEKIVSPGVFTQENDLSFVPQGISEIGAAVIGPTVKGPAFVPTILSSFEDYEEMFGGLSEDTYVPYTVKEYLKNAGTITVVRVLDMGGYTADPLAIVVYTGSSADTTGKVVSILHPSQNSDAIGGNFLQTLKAPDASADLTPGQLNFLLSGSADTTGTTVSSSLRSSDDNFIGNIFGDSPKASKSAYLYLNFKQYVSESYSTLISASFVSGSTLSVNGGTGGTDAVPRYSRATTPTIVSQHVGSPVSTYGSLITTDLFTVNHRAHGTSTNRDLKVSISNVKFASEIPNSDFGSFTLSVRKWNDTDKRPVTIETYNNLNINPDSPNYFARVVGDQYIDIDSAGKLIKYGDYPNQSRYIYVSPDAAVNNGSVAKGLIPYGHATVKQAVGSSTFGTLPTASLRISQTDSGVENGTYNKNFHYGFDFLNIDTGNDNINYLSPLDLATPVAGDNKAFNLSTLKVHPSASTGAETALSSSSSPTNARKFTIPFQGGFDGQNPATSKNTGTSISDGANIMGFDVSTGTSTGTKSYKKALNSISNPDEFDINMIITPGIISRVASSVPQKAIDVCEARGDAFYIMDSVLYNDSVSTTTTEAENWDTSYAATYYPWMKYRDTNLNKYVWVPPSVLLPSAFAFNDQIAAEWYAPAGLNRGGLTNATDVYSRLTHDERDDLYEGRVNPIAIFPGQGITVFGQKTLQSRTTALDRINVRRLMINLKKFVASTSRYLVFEQNTTATRNRFLSTVNPYLESVQQRQGLYAFKVVMDETNNTPDVIDRNILKGAIYLQPAKSAEFIVVDFNIMPTGASFED